MRARMLCTTSDAIAAAMTRAAVKARAPPPTTCGFRFSYGFPSRSPGSPKSYARACSHGRHPVRPAADDPPPTPHSSPTADVPNHRKSTHSRSTPTASSAQFRPSIHVPPRLGSGSLHQFTNLDVLCAEPQGHWLRFSNGNGELSMTVTARELYGTSQSAHLVLDEQTLEAFECSIECRLCNHASDRSCDRWQRVDENIERSVVHQHHIRCVVRG